MKFIAALAFLSAVAANPFAPKSSSGAKAEYVGKLVSKATPTANSQLRKLDQNEEYMVDLTGYSVKFEQCQFVKSYDEEAAADEETYTVLATKRFVIFRLCPSSCDTCNYNYGEYLVDLETYLESTVAYYEEVQENTCEACNECYNNQYQDAEGEENGGERKLQYEADCDTCYEECQKIENMEANGYIDATTFLECQMIYDPEDDNRLPLYAGPICASSGTKIKIGVFTDEDCLMLDSSKDVDDYLQGDNGQMKLSHALLKKTYTDTCISCLEPQDAEDNNENDNADADAVIEMCETLYDAAAKCESQHGFDDGYSQYYNVYENQLAQETTVCDFVQSLKSGTYDESGEIIVSGSSVGGGKATTGGQKFALTFFVVGTIGLAVYAAMLHSKLVKGGKADLSSSGGAMA